MRIAGVFLGAAVTALGLSGAYAQAVDKKSDQAGGPQPTAADCDAALKVHTIPKPPGEPANVSVSTLIITTIEMPDAEAKADMQRQTDTLKDCLRQLEDRK